MPKSKSRTRPSKIRKSKKNTVSVDFDGVEAGGFSIIPDGHYPMHPIKITEEESQEGNPYLAWTWKVKGGQYDGAKAPDNTSLQPQALWRLRMILEALGQDVPDGVMDIDLDEIIGEENLCMIEIVNEEYEGRDKPRPVGFSPYRADDDEEVGGEEKPKKSEKSKKSKKPKKLKVGTKVSFEDEEGDEIKGVIVEIKDDDAVIEDTSGEEWEVGLDELTAK